METILLESESPTGEKIKVYYSELHIQFIIYFQYVNSDIKMTKSFHKTMKEMVDELPLHAWVLQGVKSKELEFLIKSRIEAPVRSKDLIPLCMEINERFKTAMN